MVPAPSRGGLRGNQQRARRVLSDRSGCLGALDRDRFDVVGIGITPTGRWILVEPETVSRLAVTDGKLPELSENAAEAMLMRVRAAVKWRYANSRL